jgi:hypothetical protein
MALAIFFVVRSRRRLSTVDFLILEQGAEPVDPLLRSQLAASLLASEIADRGAHLLLNGHNGGRGSFDELRRELRTLKTYVISLDERYARRDELPWVTVQVFGVVIGIVGGIATIAWAVIELAGRH